MNINKNGISELIEVDDSLDQFKNSLKNKTITAKMEIIKKIVENVKEETSLLDQVLENLADAVGIQKVEEIIQDSDKKNESLEPILNPLSRKFTAFPISYQQIWRKYKEQMACFWKAEEIDFSNDYNDFLTLNEKEQYFIEMILAFFAASDGIVNFNLSDRFINEVQVTEIIFAYQFQAMMENVHCVSSDTEILTDQGYKKIIDLLFKNVKVWNGKEFAETIIRYTGQSQLHRVELSNGMYLDCTPDHKWFVRHQLHPERYQRSIILTKDLKQNDVIYDYDLPIIDVNDPDEFKNPYTHGFFCGDGAYCNRLPLIRLHAIRLHAIRLHGEKKNLLEEYNTSQDSNKNDISLYVTKKINKEKFFVPVNYSQETKLKWFAGICDSDGCINHNTKKTGTSIQISNNNKKFLKDIQLMLTTLGLHTNISLGKGSRQLYKCQNNYVLYITISNVKKLHDMGFRPKRLKLVCHQNINEKAKLVKVREIKLLDGIHETYCFNEPKEHAGIFNGILTGQSEVYSLMLENIVKDPNRKEFLFNAITNVESVKMMADWAFKWIESSKSFAHRVVAFAVVEGVFFSGAFAAIFWLKKYKNKNRDNAKGKPFMNGLATSNRFISRDEGIHAKQACEIYAILKTKLPTSEVNEIMKEGVIISQKFMTDALPVKLIGMNNDLMRDYIEYIGDRLLLMLGYKKIYNKNNPFKFMETIGLNDKTNFFELRPHEYQDAHVMNKSNKSKIMIKEDF
jgi:ribonucleotide reductase beta subunit family protein with ferritin-like domain